jgi:glycosyltransferase involved in cell wall biosynthesis
VKIGLVNLSEFVGGAERELLDHATALQEDYGISVLAIIDFRNTEFAAMLNKNGVAIETGCFYVERVKSVAIANPANLWRLLKQAQILRTIQKQHRLDLLVTYSFHSGLVAALARLSGMKAKIVVGQLTRRDLTRGGVTEQLQFFAADAVTYNSNAMRESFEHVARRYRRPEKVIYSYVKEPGPQQRHSMRARLITEHGLAADTTLVGFCGRIFKDKRVSDVVDAVNLLNTAAPKKFFLVVMGASSAPAEYETYVRALAQAKCPGLHHFFKFVRDPFPMMAACNVIVLPSVEPFGRVLVEAMYLGVPFVATDAAGPREIMALADARCGKLVPPMRPDLIAGAILAVTKDRPVDSLPVPYALSGEGIIGGAVQFYKDVLAGMRGRQGRAHGVEALQRDHAS